MNEQVILALSTCPNDSTARLIAEALITENLAACINRISGVRSSYMWEGALQDDSEVLLVIKSTADRLPELAGRLKELHPYELPEFLVTHADGGNEAYLDWIRRNVRSEGTRA
jgi:periplasmic divalent cation tolerance protein